MLGLTPWPSTDKTVHLFNKDSRLIEVLSWEVGGVLVNTGAGEHQWEGGQWVCLTGTATGQCVLVEETGGECQDTGVATVVGQQ